MGVQVMSQRPKAGPSDFIGKCLRSETPSLHGKTVALRQLTIAQDQQGCVIRHAVSLGRFDFFANEQSGDITAGLRWVELFKQGQASGRKCMVQQTTSLLTLHHAI